MQQSPQVLEVLEIYKTYKHFKAQFKISPKYSVDRASAQQIQNEPFSAILEDLAITHNLSVGIQDSSPQMSGHFTTEGSLPQVVGLLEDLISHAKSSRVSQDVETQYSAEETATPRSWQIKLNILLEGVEVIFAPGSKASACDWSVTLRASPEVDESTNLVPWSKKNTFASIAEITPTAQKATSNHTASQTMASSLGDSLRLFDGYIRSSSLGIGFSTSSRVHFSKLNSSDSLVKSLNHEEQNLRFNTISSFRIRDNFPHRQVAEDGVKTTLATVVSNKPIRSRCLLLQNAQFEKWSVRELSNLFTNFGNIDRVVYNIKSNGCLFVYGCPVGVQNAVNCLAGLSLLGLEIRLVPHPSDELLDNCFTGDEIAEFIPRKRFITSESGLPNIVNPVSKTLHVTFYSEESKSSLSDLQLIQIFSQIAPPVRLKRESGRRKKNMWFVEFDTSEQALKVLMQNHNRDVSGGAIRLSFTKNLA